LAENLNFYHAFSPAQKYPEGNTSGNGILSKFPIKNIINHILQEEANLTEDYSKEVVIEGKTCISAEITLPENKKLTVCTTHFNFSPFFKDNPQKTKETNNLTKFLKTKKSPLIFTGDLNSSPDSIAIKELQKILNHAGPNFSEKTWTTKPFNFRGFIEDKLNWRLDYIFTSKDIKVNNSSIVNTKFSDHLPIIAEIEL